MALPHLKYWRASGVFCARFCYTVRALAGLAPNGHFAKKCPKKLAERLELFLITEFDFVDANNLIDSVEMPAFTGRKFRL